MSDASLAIALVPRAPAAAATQAPAGQSSGAAAFLSVLASVLGEAPGGETPPGALARPPAPGTDADAPAATPGGEEEAAAELLVPKAVEAEPPTEEGEALEETAGTGMKASPEETESSEIAAGAPEDDGDQAAKDTGQGAEDDTRETVPDQAAAAIMPATQSSEPSATQPRAAVPEVSGTAQARPAAPGEARDPQMPTQDGAQRPESGRPNERMSAETSQQQQRQTGDDQPRQRFAATDRPAPPPAAPEAISSSQPQVQSLGEDAFGQLRLGIPTQSVGSSTSLPAGAGGRLDVPALAVQIVTEARGGNRSFEIQLDPPELGRIEVRLDFARDGRMTTQLLVDRPETLDALMRDARGLEKTLQQAGLRLEDGGLQYQLRDQSAFARNGGGDARTGDGQGTPGEDNEDAAETATPVPEGYRRRMALGGVDVRI